MIVVRNTRKCNRSAFASRCPHRLLPTTSTPEDHRFLSSRSHCSLSLNRQRWPCVSVSVPSHYDNEATRRYKTTLPENFNSQRIIHNYDKTCHSFDTMKMERIIQKGNDDIASTFSNANCTVGRVAEICSTPYKREKEMRNAVTSYSASLQSSYPMSTGYLHVPGTNLSFHRTAQNIILRACLSTKSHFHEQTNAKMYGIRTFASSASPSPKIDHDNQTKKIEIHVKSSDIASSKSTPSTNASSKSPFLTSAVVDTNDSWTAKKVMDKTNSFMVSSSKTIASLIFKFPGVMLFYLTHPREFKLKLAELTDAAKKEAHHYWMGSKLLAADLRTARHILGRTLEGNSLSRRERKQLLRTVTDLFRVVPMSIFVLVPFLEFALPFALKLFPNMLPSTFQDSLKAEENMKKELATRLAMAEFFQETLQNLAKDHRRRYETKITKAVEGECAAESVNIKRQETAASFLEFIDKARNGEMLPPDVIIKYSSYFKDELTLDNMPRMQLINMCKYMNILPYGSEALLRFQLRHKIRILQEDDQRILWEGIDSLTKMELREACQERGMRSTGLNKDSYTRALQQWLDLSVNQNVPISLLIMSRTFFLQKEMSGPSRVQDDSKSLTSLADAISGLDKDVVNEVVLEVATSKEKSFSPEVLAIKLEVLETQNELIQEENKMRDAVAKKKKAAEMEKMEREKENSNSMIADATKGNDLKLEAGIEINESSKEPMMQTPVMEDKTIFDKEEIKSTKAHKVTTHDVKEKGKSIPVQQPIEEIKDQEEEQNALSTEEIDAISQLVSPDPVSRERETLQRIKAAMFEKDETNEYEVSKESEKKSSMESQDLEGASLINEKDSLENETVVSTDEKKIKENSVEDIDSKAEAIVSSMEEKASREADASTSVSFSIDELGEVGEKYISLPEEHGQYEDEKLERVISHLKSKVESMVGKIEIQLSDVETKIGDKLHILDRDMDGILSREEMAICLQSVLKRKLTVEEAMAIAHDMDENEDGFFSLDELSKWLETNKIVKLVKEGRDAEVDKMISIQAAKLKGNEEAK